MPIPARVRGLFPGLTAARGYPRSWARSDVVAGIVLATLLVPQGMAYAQLAGVPPVTGLYATAVALLAYAVFGPSRRLMLGPDSAISPLVFAAVTPLVAANATPEERVALAAMLAILIGGMCVAAGFFRFGVIAELLSMPMRIGYLNGIAVVVLVSQLPGLCGFTTDAEGVVDQLRAFVDGVGDGRTNGAAVALGVAALVTIVVARRIDPRIPGVLVAVVGSAAAVVVFDLVGEGVAVVGAVPHGFPSPALPDVSLHDTGALIVAALGITFVTIADTVALSRSFASPGELVDADQEITALGAANAAVGLFQGFPLSASSSRTAVAVAAGARSQLTGVIGAVGILVLLLGANDATRNIPAASLAAIVIAASLTLFDVGALAHLARIRRSELVLAVVTIAGVVFLGLLEGIAVAGGLSLANFVRHAWRPYNVELGRIAGRKGYHDVERHPDADQIPGLVIFRFDAPLFFANAEYFAARLRGLVARRGALVQSVVVAAEPISDIDTTAAEVLEALVDDLGRQGIDVVFAELKGPVKDRLARYGLTTTLGDHGFPPTLGTAISDYVGRTGVEWVDWEDRPTTG